MLATGASCHDQVRFSSDLGGVDVETRKSTGTARLPGRGDISSLSLTANVRRSCACWGS